LIANKILFVFFALTLSIFSYSDDKKTDVLCLAKNIYHEARGESAEGQIAISNVVINRVKSKQFPNDICSVVYQKNQISFINRILEIIPINIPGCKFSWTCDRKPDDLLSDKKAWKNSQKIAEEVLNDLHHDLSKGATHYHSVFINPYWADSLNETVVIEGHKFLK
jgi:spore germination cell wall hydrolase CwlJ-like protein